VVGFDLKKQLKVHKRSLLRQLFSKERAMRTVDWYLTPKNDIEPIAEAWENLQEDRKRHYQVVLQDVDLLSNVKGQKILVEELEAQPIPMIEKFWKLTSHADKSLTVSRLRLAAVETRGKSSVFLQSKPVLVLFLPRRHGDSQSCSSLARELKALCVALTSVRRVREAVLVFIAWTVIGFPAQALAKSPRGPRTAQRTKGRWTTLTGSRYVTRSVLVGDGGRVINVVDANAVS
jgi:hypothetical protein